MSSNLQKFHVGYRYRDFEVIKSIEISELQCHLCEFVHIPTGAQVMHLGNDDPENLFCLSFQTLPESSNGVAHILEHTVLCGSQKYPVKDPFFSMTRRSLNTFMNALTGADFTCYPAATQVPKDFYNLLEVYLDAVFHPSLNKLSFLQEGHRIEFSVPDDPKSPLEYKGVVFNEMKGAMSSVNTRLYEAIIAALFPDLSYGCNSGGDPKIIPSLTYEELKSFHKQYYHPSRCLFFFYGNMPIEKHLDFIEEKALKGVSKALPLPLIPLQPRFLEPRYVQERYPIAPEEQTESKALIAFGWLTCHILNQEEVLALSIIESILLDTDASPLKMALLKSGLCQQVSSYIDTDITEIPFVITLRGCNSENADALEEVIKICLDQIIYKGIPLAQIENILHQLEFHRSEINGDHGPYGLSLFMRAALLKQHQANPEEGLKIHSLVEDLRKRNLENPNYFTDLIQKYLIDNKHFVRIVMEPDQHLAAQEEEAEKATLKSIREKLSPSQVNKILKQAADLAAFQEKQEEVDQDILPKVTLDDVTKLAREFPLQKETIGNLQVFHHNTFTNSIIYADLVYDLPEIGSEDLYLVRLFALLISQMGCGDRSYVDNLEYIQANTGGVGAALNFNVQVQNSNLFQPTFYIRGKALHRKAEKLFKLLKEMVTLTHFTDLPRLREVIMKHFTNLHSTLNQTALRYAINLSASGLDVPSWIANEWYGLSYYNKIKDLSENLDQELSTLSAKLQHLQSSLLGLENPHLILTCNAAMYDELKHHQFYGLADIPVKPFKPWKSNFSIEKVPAQGRTISSPVAFIGKVFKTVSYTHPHAAALNVAAFMCDNLVLHAKVREQGGAYGAGATCNSMSGNFYFYSYRDPNISSTLRAFDEVIAVFVEGLFDDSDLEEAKLEMIQALDSPIPPGSRGELAYGWLREGKTHSIRQKFRDKVLALTCQDVVEAVIAEILPHYGEGVPVVFAGKDLLEKENIILIAAGQKILPLQTV